MKPFITTFKHEGVQSDGTFIGKGGAVTVKGNIKISHPDGGCGLDTCNCSPGHWITCGLPIDNEGTVRGMKLEFKSRKQLLKYLGVREKKDV